MVLMIKSLNTTMEKSLFILQESGHVIYCLVCRFSVMVSKNCHHFSPSAVIFVFSSFQKVLYISSSIIVKIVGKPLLTCVLQNCLFPFPKLGRHCSSDLHLYSLKHLGFHQFHF